MLRPYQQNLEKIEYGIQSIGNEVVDALEEALKAIKTQELSDLKKIDLSVKQIVIKSDEIDNLIIKTLALHSPEASDLRSIVAYLKMSNELVRTAGNVKDFTKLFKKSFSDDLNKEVILEYAIPLLKSALVSLRTATTIFEETDENAINEKYQRVTVEESKTDDLYAMVEKNIFKLASENIELSKDYFEVLSSLRRLEKVADRAASISNLLVFAEVGGIIEQA
jgi:phosphate transport system protein